MYVRGERDPVLAWRVKTYVRYGLVLNTDYYIDQRGQIIIGITNIYTVAVGAQGADVLGANRKSRGLTISKNMILGRYRL